MPGRSSTPNRKSSPGKSSAKYDYVELSKAKLSTDEHQNFYGVIVDATFPYQVKADKMFMTILKVVDPTLHDKSNYAQIIMYANKFEDLPIVHRLGDVIRVHRAKTRMFNGKRQFVVNMFYSSSWALYSTDRQTPLGTASTEGPYAFSGKRSTHERQDTAIQSNLKKWASNHFAKNNGVVGNHQVDLSKASKQSGDFDVCAKVLQVFELDEYTNELKIRDNSGTTFYTLALKLKFPHIRHGSVVRIRSATYDATSKNKNVLILQHYSNIMTLIGSSKLGAQLGKVAGENSTEKAALKSSVSMAPVVLTEVDKKWAHLPNTSLHDLFHNSDNSTNTFRTCFYVTRVEPGNSKDAVKHYNRQTKKTGSSGDLIYQVQFLAKDVSTNFNNNVYRILLYTHEGLGGNFLGQKPAAGGNAKVQAQFGLLTRFNSWVDAVVERRNGYYFIKDTKMVF